MLDKSQNGEKNSTYNSKLALTSICCLHCTPRNHCVDMDSGSIPGGLLETAGISLRFVVIQEYEEGLFIVQGPVGAFLCGSGRHSEQKIDEEMKKRSYISTSQCTLH